MREFTHFRIYILVFKPHKMKHFHTFSKPAQLRAALPLRVMSFLLFMAFFLNQGNLFAQCNQITMEATATVATCYNNGTITVTIDGPDIENLKLDDAQFQFTPDGPGTTVSWTSSLTDLGSVKTFEGFTADTYTIELQAFCKDNPGGGWGVQGLTTRVTVGTTYSNNPISFNAYPSQSPMACKPNTGQIRVDINWGNPPYEITIDNYPGTYLGPFYFPTSTSINYIKNLPAGNYEINVVDHCGNSPSTMYPILTAKLSDFPNSTNTYMGNRYVSGNCKSVRWYASLYNEDYWEYEYDFVNDVADVKKWKPCNTTSFSFDTELPAPYNTYADLCVVSPSPTVGYFCLRLKDCPTDSVCYPIAANYALCNFNLSTEVIDIFGNCNDADLRIFFPESAGVCYPVNYSIEQNGGALIRTGTIPDYNGAIESALPRGFTYKVEVTEPTSTRQWTLLNVNVNTNAGQSFTGESILNHNPSYGVCNDKSIRLSTNGYISENTAIKYVSGPGNPVLGMGSVGTTMLAPPSTNYFYPTVSSNHFTTTSSPNEYVSLPLGTYTFEVTNNCNVPSTVIVDVSDLEMDQPLNYTTAYQCSPAGFKFTLIGGRLKKISSGSIETTYYTIYRNGTYYNYYTWNANISTPPNFPQFTQAGTYKIYVSTNYDANCPYDSVTFTAFDGLLTYNASSLSSYYCSGSGHIYVEAVGGNPPYTYDLCAQGSTTPLVSNSTGVFNYGVAGTTYDIRITDACGAYTTATVLLRDVPTSTLAYTSNGGFFCEGAEVDLNVLSLGPLATYTWYLLPDEINPVYTVQNPRFPAVYPGSSGTYKVTVTPDGCGISKDEYLPINIHSAPTAPDTIISSVGLVVCEGTSITLTAVGGIEGEDGVNYQWGANTGVGGLHEPCTYFDPELGNAHTITVTPTPTTGMGGADYLVLEPTYWVRKTGKGACASTVTGCVQIQITLKPPSKASMMRIDDPGAICSGTGTTLTAYADMPLYYFGHNVMLEGTPIFRWYPDATSTTLLYEGNPFPTGNLAATTTFWVSVEGDNFCEGENSTDGRKPISVYVEDCVVCPQIKVNKVIATDCAPPTYTITGIVTEDISAFTVEVNGDGIGIPISLDLDGNFTYSLTAASGTPLVFTAIPTEAECDDEIIVTITLP